MRNPDSWEEETCSASRSALKAATELHTRFSGSRKRRQGSFQAVLLFLSECNLNASGLTSLGLSKNKEGEGTYFYWQCANTNYYLPYHQKVVSIKESAICSWESPKKRVTENHKAECQQQPLLSCPSLCLSFHLPMTDYCRMNGRNLLVFTLHGKSISSAIKDCLQSFWSAGYKTVPCFLQKEGMHLLLLRALWTAVSAQSQ